MLIEADAVSNGKHVSDSSEPPIDTSIMPRSRRLLRRRSSHLSRWIKDQSETDKSEGDASTPIVIRDDSRPGISRTSVGTPASAWLAYPHLRDASHSMPSGFGQTTGESVDADEYERVRANFSCRLVQ